MIDVSPSANVISIKLSFETCRSCFSTGNHTILIRSHLTGRTRDNHNNHSRSQLYYLIVQSYPPLEKERTMSHGSRENEVICLPFSIADLDLVPFELKFDLALFTSPEMSRHQMFRLLQMGNFTNISQVLMFVYT